MGMEERLSFEVEASRVSLIDSVKVPSRFLIEDRVVFLCFRLFMSLDDLDREDEVLEQYSRQLWFLLCLIIFKYLLLAFL